MYCILNEALGIYLHIIHFENTFILFAFFTIVEFSSFCLFYYYTLSAGLIKKAVLLIWICFIVFALYQDFTIKNIEFDSITSGVESILIILMCICYLVVQIKGSTDLLVYSTTSFWVLITFLIYLCGTFFLYIMAVKMFHDRTFQIQYAIINSAFNILKNILLSAAMVMKTEPVKTKLIKNDDRDDLLSYKLKN